MGTGKRPRRQVSNEEPERVWVGQTEFPDLWRATHGIDWDAGHCPRALIYLRIIKASGNVKAFLIDLDKKRYVKVEARTCRHASAVLDEGLRKDTHNWTRFTKDVRDMYYQALLWELEG